jgi:hypothetical protein
LATPAAHGKFHARTRRFCCTARWVSDSIPHVQGMLVGWR